MALPTRYNVADQLMGVPEPTQVHKVMLAIAREYVQASAPYVHYKVMQTSCLCLTEADYNKLQALHLINAL